MLWMRAADAHMSIAGPKKGLHTPPRRALQPGCPADWHRLLLSDQWGSDPPTHITKIPPVGTTKCIKGTRNLRPIFGPPNFVLASDTPRGNRC